MNLLLPVVDTLIRRRKRREKRRKGEKRHAGELHAVKSWMMLLVQMDVSGASARLQGTPVEY